MVRCSLCKTKKASEKKYFIVNIPGSTFIESYCYHGKSRQTISMLDNGKIRNYCKAEYYIACKVKSSKNFTGQAIARLIKPKKSTVHSPSKSLIRGDCHAGI